MLRSLSLLRSIVLGRCTLLPAAPLWWGAVLLRPTTLLPKGALRATLLKRLLSFFAAFRNILL